MSTLSYIFAACVIISTGCTEPKSKSSVQPETEISVSKIDADSTDFYKKFKALYPAFVLQVDTSAAYANAYTKYKDVDTSSCSSFKLNRIFIGKIENVLAEVKLCDREYNKYHVQSGNLKLWVCSLPAGVKTNDKILITAHVYDIMGFERVFGYPTIMSRIQFK
jgi:hypothetical protein